MNLKYFSRTPGSRQPSPAEEHLPRMNLGLDQSGNVNSFSQPMMAQMQHMLNNQHEQHQQQMNSSFHHQHHQMNHHVMNGGMQVQVRLCKKKMAALDLYEVVE